jgi:hypothetical protein
MNHQAGYEMNITGGNEEGRCPTKRNMHFRTGNASGSGRDEIHT